MTGIFPEKIYLLSMWLARKYYKKIKFVWYPQNTWVFMC